MKPARPLRWIALATATALAGGCGKPASTGTGEDLTAPSVRLSKGGGTYASLPFVKEVPSLTSQRIPHREVAKEQINVGKYRLGLSVDMANPIHWDSRLSYALSFRNLPKNTHLYITIVHDTPQLADSFAGRYGTLYKATPIVSSANLSLNPILESKSCWEIDLPAQCTLAPGRYRLQAIFLNPPSTGVFPGPDYKPGTVIGLVYSKPFYVTGDLPLDLFGQRLENSARGYVFSKTGFNLERRSSIFKDQPAGGTVKKTSPCQTFTLLPPFRGNVTSCIPQSSFTDAGIRGNHMKVGGVLGYTSSLRPQDAVALAEYTARTYRRDAALPTTPEAKAMGSPIRNSHVAMHVDNWDYQDQAWSFYLYDSQYQVLVRVEDDGNSCVAAIKPILSAKPLDERDVLIPCQSTKVAARRE